MTETNTTQTKESTGKVRGLVVGLSSALGLMTAGTIFLASGALGVGPTANPVTTPGQVVAATSPAGTTSAKTTAPGTSGITTPEQGTSNGSINGTGGTSIGTTTGKTSGGNSAGAPAPAAPAPAVEAAPAPPAAPTGADSTGYVRPEVYLANVTCEAVGDGNFRVTEYWAVRGGNHNGGRWSNADGNGVLVRTGPFGAGSPLVRQAPGSQSFLASSMNGSGMLIDEVSSPSMPFIDSATKCH